MSCCRTRNSSYPKRCENVETREGIVVFVHTRYLHRAWTKQERNSGMRRTCRKPPVSCTQKQSPTASSPHHVLVQVLFHYSQAHLTARDPCHHQCLDFWRSSVTWAVIIERESNGHIVIILIWSLLFVYENKLGVFLPTTWLSFLLSNSMIYYVSKLWIQVIFK